MSKSSLCPPIPAVTRTGRVIPPRMAAFLLAVSVLMSGCSGGGGGGDSASASSDTCVLTQAQLDSIQHIDDLPAACRVTLPLPEDNLIGRVFVAGTQVDGTTGELFVYVNGTAADGRPLDLTDFQKAVVSVDGVPVTATVAPVSPGDRVLSLGLVIDYSTSIQDAELAAVTAVYEDILGWLPLVYEGEVINFSGEVALRQDWTGSKDTLVAAVQVDSSMARNNTAFYDALGMALQRDLADDTDGLVERCRPAHMLIAFTDGQDNASYKYSIDSLRPVVGSSNTVMIMLGTLLADSAELTSIAGSNGAFAYAYDVSSIQAVVGRWSESLGNMVKFTLAPATGFDSGVVTISLPGQTVTVVRPADGFCESAP